MVVLAGHKKMGRPGGFRVSGSRAWLAERQPGTLPAVLSAARAYAGLSLGELAEQLRQHWQPGEPSVPRTMRHLLHNYESGRKHPPADRISQIAAGCGVSIMSNSDGAWSFHPLGSGS